MRKYKIKIKSITRNNKTFIFQILFLILLHGNLFSQGAYLERGQSGLGIGAAYSTNDNVSGVAGGVGYSSSGVFDFGINVGRFSPNDSGENDLRETAVSPFIAIHAIKQDSYIPISVALFGAYEFDSYSSDALKQLNWSMSGNYVSFGGSIYTNIGVSPTANIQPSFGLSYVTGKTELKDNYYGESISEENSFTVYNIGFGIFFDTGNGTIFYIKPGMGFNSENDNTTFLIGGGFVFPSYTE